ncbi:hypothetical protein SPRG_06360 [Saprolegnia parasitica CBS 223.65]|uniref:DNA/RNA-binding protein Alba-like domain-containing protein n=1 Tax=Saprolegnia parasitica (strain CBS 223.65) TaxID=695850 RepID=A0A067CGL4_SAPPC|nr:hypothetical protein SPRG_06360 [Saprolegnia parasitica CBS 223.65]KDO28310.1 hypothetical protein SPRG_06360 [Saprolegnia parasitica CBS 223.65]|eukprot:XP_012201129.1 hypothetical protein SPRG_06360 [Saprolegnia parasitica CBS 223.65]
MDKYRKAKPTTKPSEPNQVRVGEFAHAFHDKKKHVAKVKKLLRNGAVVVTAHDTAIVNAVTVAELVKSTLACVHSVVHISTVNIEEIYEPLEEGLDVVTVPKRVSAISIHLSTDATTINTADASYTQPLSPRQVARKPQQDGTPPLSDGASKHRTPRPVRQAVATTEEASPLPETVEEKSPAPKKRRDKKPRAVVDPVPIENSTVEAGAALDVDVALKKGSQSRKPRKHSNERNAAGEHSGNTANGAPIDRPARRGSRRGSTETAQVVVPSNDATVVQVDAAPTKSERAPRRNNRGPRPDTAPTNGEAKQGGEPDGRPATGRGRRHRGKSEASNSKQEQEQ